MQRLFYPSQAKFQSTLPRGERPLRIQRLQPWVKFQSTLPRGERLASPPTLCRHRKRFNPRSRAGSDSGQWPEAGGRLLRFNPRSRAGSDSFARFTGEGLAEFQSTLPRGERQPRAPKFPVRVYVSIHAPAGGATTTRAQVSGSSICFNPRSRGGSDNHARPSFRFEYMFQSTLPRGERRQAARAALRPDWFQSTLPAGGATSAGICLRIATSGFNPRSRGGSDS